jgi:zinc transport system substrate-binding protein
MKKVRDNNSMKDLWRQLILFILVAILIISSYFALSSRFSTPTSQSKSKLKLTASFYPLAEFAHRVGQEHVEVLNLTAPGAEPHDFDPSPQDFVQLENSQVFVYNGAGLEIWLDKLSPEIKQKVIMVNASEGVSLLPGSEEDQKLDPHVWLDPVSASQEVTNITEALSSADPSHKDFYQKNATDYLKQLSDLDAQFRTGLAECQSRNIVTSHNAFQYLAQRYNLNVLSLSGLSPDEEPTPKKLAEVVEFVKQHQVKYIFFETLVSPKLSETIAQETGAKTIAFNPLEGLTEDEIAQGKNYISVQRDNLVALRTALECK